MSIPSDPGRDGAEDRRRTHPVAAFLLTSAARRRLHRGPRQRALTISVVEAIVAGGMFAALNLWLVPLLAHLGGSSRAIAVALGLGLLGPAIVGPFAPWLIAACGGPKRAAVLGSAMQAAMCGLLGALALPAVAGVLGERAFAIAAVITFANSLIGGLTSAAWMTWMGNLVPPRIRGRYLGRRNMLFLISLTAFVALYAAIAEVLPPAAGLGLAAILGIGMLSRTASVMLMARQPELPPHRIEGYRSAALPTPKRRGLLPFLRSMPGTDLGRWMLVSVAIQFAAILGGPFFTQFLCHAGPDGLDLDDSAPFLYSLIMQTNPIVTMLMMPIVGWLIDTRGPTAVLRAGLCGVVLIPVSMTFFPTVPMIIAGEVVSGISWCMVNSAVGVLLLSSHPDPVERSRLIGYHQMLTALCQASASALGAVLIGLLPPLDGSAFRTIFLISMLLRLPVLILALRWLPSLRFPDGDERRGLWRMIPGLQEATGLGRSLWRTVWGDND